MSVVCFTPYQHLGSYFTAKTSLEISSLGSLVKHFKEGNGYDSDTYKFHSMEKTQV